MEKEKDMKDSKNIEERMSNINEVQKKREEENKMMKKYMAQHW